MSDLRKSLEGTGITITQDDDLSSRILSLEQKYESLHTAMNAMLNALDFIQEAGKVVGNEIIEDKKRLVDATDRILALEIQAGGAKAP